MTVSPMRPLLSSHNYRRQRAFGFPMLQEKMLGKPQPMMAVHHTSDDESSTVSSKPVEKRELSVEKRELVESVFRRRMDAADELEEFWTLKRANAVIEDDDGTSNP